MEDMKDNALKVQFRNRLRDDCQLSYCRVQINNASISKINEVSMFFDGRIVNTDRNVLIGSEIFLILGGGVRVIRDRKDVNTNLIEMEWNSLLRAIDCLSDK